MSAHRVDEFVSDTAGTIRQEIQRSYRDFLLVFLSLWITSFLVSFVVVEYFSRDSWGAIFSFKSSDKPGNVTAECPLQPVGKHYFGDLVSTSCHSRMSNPYGQGLGYNYPPAMYLAGKPFGWLHGVDFRLSLVLFLAIFLVMIYVLRRTLSVGVDSWVSSQICLLMILSAAGFALFDRGNLQVLIILGTLAWIYKTATRKPCQASLYLGLAGGLKLYPLVFSLVYVRNRQWRNLSVVALGAIVSNVCGLLVLQPQLLSNPLAVWREIAIFLDAGAEQLRYSSSFRALLISATQLNLFQIGDLFGYLAQHKDVASLIGIVSFLLVLFYMRVGIFEVSTLGSVVCCLFIDRTANYMLSLLWMPLAAYQFVDIPTKASRLILFLIGFVLVPKGFVLTPLVADNQASLQSVANPIALMAIGVLLPIHLKSKRRSSREAIVG